MLLRKTQSVCPVCINEINADIIEENNKVFMVKTCNKHGKFKILLSKDPKYYKKLHEIFNDFGFKKKNKEFVRNYYNFYLTLRCNLNCKMCLTKANESNIEPSLKTIKNILSKMKKTKIGLWGGEPTVRKDLSKIIEIVKKSGNIPALYTNGIKISKINYLKTLKESGLDIVHLQFDGFNDNIYTKIRGRKLLKIKLKTLNNLKKLNVPTVLETTFVKGLNEKEMLPILNFAIKNRFITAILFRSYSHQGRKGLDKNQQILGEELIDTLEKQTKGKVSKKNILRFQKLLYAIYNLTSTKRCFYNQYYMINRKKKGFNTIDQVINLDRIEKKIDKYLKKKNKFIAKLYLALMLSKEIFNKEITKFVSNWIKIYIERKLLKKSFTSSLLPNNFLILGFGCICNAYDYEEDCKRVCIGGEILPNGRIISSLVESNLLREKMKYEANLMN